MMEIEQLLEDVTTIESTGVLKEFSSGDDLENGSGDSIGDATSRAARVCSPAGPEIVLSPPELVAVRETGISPINSLKLDSVVLSRSTFPRSDIQQLSDGRDRPAGPDAIGDDHQVDGDRQPEHQAEHDFQCLVAKQSRGQIGTRPAAEKTEDVKRSFRDSRLVLDRSPFIEAVQNERDHAACDGQQKVDREERRYLDAVADESENEQRRRACQPQKRKKRKPSLQP